MVPFIKLHVDLYNRGFTVLCKTPAKDAVVLLQGAESVTIQHEHIPALITILETIQKHGDADGRRDNAAA